MHSKYRDFNFSWSQNQTGLQVEVSFVVKGLDEYSLIKNSLQLSKEFINDSELKEISEIIISPKVTGLNRYGNDSFDYAARLEIERSEVVRINWNNMDVMLFKSFLQSSDAFWINDK